MGKEDCVLHLLIIEWHILIKRVRDLRDFNIISYVNIYLIIFENMFWKSTLLNFRHFPGRELVQVDRRLLAIHTAPIIRQPFIHLSREREREAESEEYCPRTQHAQ